MDAIPNPSECSPTFSDANGLPRRELDCSRYRNCLDRAVKAGWRDWSCVQCELRGSVQTARRAGGYAWARTVDPFGP